VETGAVPNDRNLYISPNALILTISLIMTKIIKLINLIIL